MSRIILLIAIALFIFSGCNKNDMEADAYGNFETEDLIISAEMQGKLIKLDIEEGTKLKAGEIVGIIDTSQLWFSLQQLKAKRATVGSKTGQVYSQIRVYEEQQKKLSKEIERVKRLKEGGAATDKQLDDLQSQYKVTQRQIESISTQNSTVLSELTAIDYQIKQMEDRIKRCYITNPIDGIVLQQYTHQFELALPGKNLYKIAPMDHLILRAYVSGALLPQIKLGQNVKVFIDRNKKEKDELTGIITWISDEAEFTPKIIQTKEERVKLVYAIKIKVPNDGRLKIGMPGEMKIVSTSENSGKDDQ